MYESHLSLIRVTRRTHLILLDLISRIIFEALYYAISAPFLPRTTVGPNIFLSILLSSTLSLCSSLNVTDQVSLPCKEKEKNYSSAYFNFYILAQRTPRQKILHRMTARIPRAQHGASQTDLNHDLIFHPF
jgi:hypothetical protein